MNNINKKSILIAIVIFMVGLLITGGTYAYLTVAMTVSNGNYVTNTHCFNVTYTGDSDSITGTLFPSANAANGLMGGITAAISPSCAITSGRGTLYLHVDSGTSTALTSTVDGHCEVVNSLGTLSNIDNATSCNAVDGAHWVTNGTALKYMVMRGDDLYSSGYIKTTDIGNDITIHDDFSVTATAKTWNVYIWLDGYLSGEDYVDLPFGGTIRMNTAQIKSTDTTFTGDTPIMARYLSQSMSNKMDLLYQRVQYIQSTGTQYIDTGLTAKNNTGFYIDFQPTTTTTAWKSVFGARPNGANGAGDFSIWLKPTSNDVVTVARQNQSVSVPVTANQRVTISLDAEKRVFGDGVYKGSFTASLSVNPSMKVFTGQAASHILPSKLYSLVIYEGDTIMRDFVPCKRRSDNVAGLCDVANNTFYTNAATSGAGFTVGPDVNQ